MDVQTPAGSSSQTPRHAQSRTRERTGKTQAPTMEDTPTPGTVTNGMKLAGISISVAMIPRPGFVEQAVLFGAAFCAARFDAIGAVRDRIGGDPAEQACGQSQGFGSCAGLEHQRKYVAPSMHCPGEAEAVQVAIVLASRVPHE